MNQLLLASHFFSADSTLLCLHGIEESEALALDEVLASGNVVTGSSSTQTTKTFPHYQQKHCFTQLAFECSLE